MMKSEVLGTWVWGFKFGVFGSRFGVWIVIRFGILCLEFEV